LLVPQAPVGFEREPVEDRPLAGLRRG